MDRCECEILYGDPEIVSVTARTPHRTVTVVESAKGAVRKFADAWSRAASPLVFNQFLERFFELADSDWSELVQPEPAGAHLFKFSITPITERAVRKKTGFSLAKNEERRFYRVKPATDFITVKKIS